MSRTRIAVVMSGFPRRSETFALNELTALHELGMLAGIYALKRGDVDVPQPDALPLMSTVHLLDEASGDQQAAALAQMLDGKRVNGIHAYFAHAPAGVAERAAAHLSVPFGFSVHARDARKVPGPLLAARAARAACVIACNRDVAADLRVAGAASHLVPHGVNLDRFAARASRPRTGLRVLAVGRLVEKKGFNVLIEALTATEPTTTLRIVGDGPERERLTRQTAACGVEARVAFAGSCTHETLPQEYANADVVVVPSVVDRSGDRDGLPNVVLEAMACGRAVVGTRVGAIEQAITHGVTGVLAVPGCAASIASGLRTLSANRRLREDLGRRARAFVQREYDVRACVQRFANVLEAAYA